jgi:hypothetical protein
LKTKHDSGLLEAFNILFITVINRLRFSNKYRRVKKLGGEAKKRSRKTNAKVNIY